MPTHSPCILWCTCLLFFSGTSLLQAQSFLEKLEATVRQQIADATAEPAADDLPPPQSEVPANPLGPMPVPVPASPLPEDTIEPSVTPAPSGAIYLGLEAENSLVGGMGVRVATVNAGSPAWRAGIEVGDRIQAINGFAIADLDGMVEQLSKTSPGETVSFLVSRANRNIQLKAVLMDASIASQVTPQATAAQVGTGWIGVTVNDLTAAFRRQFGIAVYRGAAVGSVELGSPAAKAGIRAGDAIIEADGQPIQSARDLTDWIATTRTGQRVQILFYRGGFSQVAEFTLETNPASRASTIPSVPPPSSLPSILAKPVAPAAPDQTALIQELEAQNRRLTKQLQDTQQKLRQTESKLEQIMQLLEDR